MSPSSPRVRAPLLRQQWDRLRRFLIFSFLTLCSPLLWAKDSLQKCDSQLAPGSKCRIDINALHPTQPGIGLLQVDEEVQKLREKSAKKLWKYAQKKRIPVVIGPDGKYWLVDRHHLTRSLWTLGMREVPVEIEAVLSGSRWRRAIIWTFPITLGI